jgi:hypothetical protein
MATQSTTVDVPYEIWRQPDAIKALKPTAAMEQLIELNNRVHERNQRIIKDFNQQTDRLDTVECEVEELTNKCDALKQEKGKMLDDHMTQLRMLRLLVSPEQWPESLSNIGTGGSVGDYIDGLNKRVAAEEKKYEALTQVHVQCVVEYQDAKVLQTQYKSKIQKLKGELVRVKQAKGAVTDKDARTEQLESEMTELKAKGANSKSELESAKQIEKDKDVRIKDLEAKVLSLEGERERAKEVEKDKDAWIVKLQTIVPYLSYHMLALYLRLLMRGTQHEGFRNHAGSVFQHIAGIQHEAKQLMMDTSDQDEVNITDFWPPIWLHNHEERQFENTEWREQWKREAPKVLTVMQKEVKAVEDGTAKYVLNDEDWYKWVEPY